MTDHRCPFAAIARGAAAGLALALLAAAPAPSAAQTPLPPGYAVPTPPVTPTPPVGAQHQRYFMVPQASVSPFGLAAVPGRPHLILGPVRPYTDDEYGRLVLSTLAYGQSAPVTQRLDERSLVAVTAESDGTRTYARAAARVLDVLDRGRMLTDTGETVKLRGVRVSSERDSNEVVAFCAREAMRTMRRLTLQGPVFIEFADPLRSSDGTLMGIVRLGDGTELNRLILELGLARAEPTDFPDDIPRPDLLAAEQHAKDAKLGIWSKR